jgi:hypothetical protein
VTGTFSDPGVLDAPWLYVITWGDGASSTGTTITQSAPISASHAYTGLGTFTIRMSVTDKDGGTGKSTKLGVQVVPATRQVTTVTGSWKGTSYSFAELFTVPSNGPVDATATVSGYTGPLRLALLGFNPQGGTSTCSTVWLPTSLPPGPTMNPPKITAHWDGVPPGTYCLNVVSTSTPLYPPLPYNWTATITYP